MGPLYLGFIVFSYNLSIHSSTGFTPFYLTFGSEARLPPDIVFGAPSLSTSNGISKSERTSSMPLSLLLKSFTILNRAFTSVRENLRAFHQREKDRYDLGAVERVFQVGDQVRVRLKSRQKGYSKFHSQWSGIHEVLRVRGVVVTVRELSSGREYHTHHDRLSNPLFSQTTREPGHEPRHEANANPLDNLREPEEDSEPRGNPEEALIRTRSGRVVRPPRRDDFDYSGMLPTIRQTNTFPSTSTATCSASASLPTSISLSSRSLAHSCASSVSVSPAHAPSIPGTLPPLQESTVHRDQRVRREQRERLANLGQKVQWVTDADGTPQQLVLLRTNGTLFQLDVALGDWVALTDGTTTLTDIENAPTWPFTGGDRLLSDAEVTLPQTLEEMPGNYTIPRYGFTPQWLRFVQVRSQTVVAPNSSLNPEASLAPAPTSSTESTETRLPSATALKPTVGAPWIPAARVTTAAPLFTIESLVGSGPRPPSAPTANLAPTMAPPTSIIVNPFQFAPPTTSALLFASEPWPSSTQLIPTSTASGASNQPPTSAPTPSPQMTKPTTHYRASESTGQFSLTASGTTSHAFHSLATEGSTSGAIREAPAPPASTPAPYEEQLTEAEMREMLNEPLGKFLDRFSEHPTEDVRILHNRELTSTLAQLGYEPDVNLPPVDRPNLNDLSVFGYLQITEPVPSNNIIVLTIEEFNALINKIAFERHGALRRWFEPRHIGVEELRVASNLVVRDPRGLLSGSAVAGPAALLPPTTTTHGSTLPSEESLTRVFRAMMKAATEAASEPRELAQAPTRTEPRTKTSTLELSSSLASGPEGSEASAHTPMDAAEFAEELPDVSVLQPLLAELPDIATPVVPRPAPTPKTSSAPKPPHGSSRRERPTFSKRPRIDEPRAGGTSTERQKSPPNLDRRLRRLSCSRRLRRPRR